MSKYITPYPTFKECSIFQRERIYCKKMIKRYFLVKFDVFVADILWKYTLRFYVTSKIYTHKRNAILKTSIFKYTFTFIKAILYKLFIQLIYLNRWWMEQGINTINCRICLNDIQANEFVWSNCHCAHTFHDHCIMRWIQVQIKEVHVQTCPLCRSNWNFKFRRRLRNWLGIQNSYPHSFLIYYSKSINYIIIAYFILC